MLKLGLGTQGMAKLQSTELVIVFIAPFSNRIAQYVLSNNLQLEKGLSRYKQHTDVSLISFIVVPLGGIVEIIPWLFQSLLRMLIIMGMNKGMQAKNSLAPHSRM